MKTAKEIIISVLNEELPDIADAKRDIIVDRIIKGLQTNNLGTDDLDEVHNQVWMGLVMTKEEKYAGISRLKERILALKKDVDIDEFAEMVSQEFEMPFFIAKSYTLIAHNWFVRGDAHAVAGNIYRLLCSEMPHDVYEVLKCSEGEASATVENAKRLVEQFAAQIQ